MMHIYQKNITTWVRNKANSFYIRLKMAVLPTYPFDINNNFSDISKQNIHTCKFCQENGAQCMFTHPNPNESMLWKFISLLESKMTLFENATYFVIAPNILYVN